MLNSARRTATRLAHFLPRHLDEFSVAQQSRLYSPCASLQFGGLPFQKSDPFGSLSHRIQQTAMCDISKRPGRSAAQTRSFSSVIYPPSEARVGGPAPDFSAPGKIVPICGNACIKVRAHFSTWMICNVKCIFKAHIHSFASFQACPVGA